MLIGKRVSGRYKIIRMIGDGGMANVYLARDIILDRDVAIKILRISTVNEEEFIRRFQREAQAATSLAHQNIVSIYDVGEEDQLHYIVMEYVDGMTLKQFIQQQHPIPLTTVLDIMRQLTSGVAHAHENHIVHRDIKPQNILIDHDGNVKITDFGIAIALSSTSITQTNAVLGSVHYLSPEQARGGMATSKSDIYSLGIVMFELLTGRLPFSGESAVSIALKHLQSDTPPPTRWNPDIPQSMENIVLKATAKDPFVRYSDAEEMGRDLESALDPMRQHEERFEIPEDTEATKIIPAFIEKDLVAEQSGAENRLTDKPPQMENKKKRRKWPVIVGSIIGLLVLTLLFFVFVMPAMFDSKNVVIPDVRDEQYDDAVRMLVEAGLTIGETIEATDEEIGEGKVIKTDPKASKEVKKGSTVKLYVSEGKETITFSDFEGSQYTTVEELLNKQGFSNIRKEEKHDEAPAGMIIDQEPTPNSEVIPSETQVIFTVSLGEKKINLADLRGYNKKALESYEETTGILIDMSTEEYHDTVEAGLVISQSHEPGDPIAKGERVKVIMSKGKEAIPPETVTKKIIIPYEPVEEGIPQEVKIYIEDMNNSMVDGPTETFMIDSTVEKELHFMIEKGKKAGFKVFRDSTVYEEGEIPYPGE